MRSLRVDEAGAPVGAAIDLGASGAQPQPVTSDGRWRVAFHDAAAGAFVVTNAQCGE